MKIRLETLEEGEIYVDTMMFYMLLRTDEKMRSLVKEFFERIELGAVRAYTSVLTFDELAYRLILALVKEKHGGSPLDRLRERETDLLKEFSPLIVPKLKLLRVFPNLQVVEILPQDTQRMLQNMLDYPLRPRDALHLATMQRICCLNIASRDEHFDVVPTIRRFC